MSVLFKLLDDNVEFCETGEQTYIARNKADISKLFEPESLNMIVTQPLKTL